MQDLQPYIDTLIQALIGLVVTFALAGIAKARSKAEAWLETRTNAQQRELIHRLAAEGMALVEATYKDVGGPAKLAEAYRYVSRRVEEIGINIPEEAIRAAIEKAVLDYNTRTKAVQ